MANYSVEYRGPKSMEEKGIEQAVGPYYFASVSFPVLILSGLSDWF